MAHLFGEDATVAMAPSARSMDISIDGIIYSDDSDSALAILKIDGNTDIFRVGDTLPDGEKILALAPTAVELGGPGAPRVLQLKQDFGDGGPGGVLAGDVGGAARADLFAGLPAAHAGGYTSVLRPVALPQGADALGQLRSLRQQLISQPPPRAPVRPAKSPSKP
jgi:hypothetical protein